MQLDCKVQGLQHFLSVMTNFSDPLTSGWDLKNRITPPLLSVPQILFTLTSLSFVIYLLDSVRPLGAVWTFPPIFQPINCLQAVRWYNCRLTLLVFLSLKVSCCPIYTVWKSLFHIFCLVFLFSIGK